MLPYTEREVAIVSSLAGQAAVSIENGMLYQDIENLFAGFIKAAVTAIDRRDPTTSGHSVRVTELTCDVAEVISAQTEGPFANIFFTDAEEIADYRDFCSKVDRMKFRDFALRLMDKGIYMNPSATLHSLSSIVHTEADIDATAKAMAEVLEEMP